jgi:hypothetical protein
LEEAKKQGGIQNRPDLGAETKTEALHGKTIALFLSDLRTENRLPDWEIKKRGGPDLPLLQVNPHPPRPYAGGSGKGNQKIGGKE